jgi:hypothetical protein
VAWQREEGGWQRALGRAYSNHNASHHRLMGLSLSLSPDGSHLAVGAPGATQGLGKRSDGLEAWSSYSCNISPPYASDESHVLASQGV